jgi:hypothetical protein
MNPEHVNQFCMSLMQAANRERFNVVESYNEALEV